MLVVRISFILVLIPAIMRLASAESLWTPNPSRGLFADLRPSQVGDLITVLIVEESASSIKASSGFGKNMNHDNAAGIGPIMKLLPELGFKSSQTSSASGQTVHSNTFVTRLAAHVTSVLPNGNLEIEANREMIINGEKHGVKLRGIVRPQDISADNVVLSTSLADVNIDCTGKGPIGNRQREGAISRLLRFIF